MPWHRGDTPLESYYSRAFGEHLPRSFDRLMPKDKDDQMLAEIFFATHNSLNNLGRPCFLISSEVANVAYSFDLSEEDLKFSVEHLPYSCFLFVFQKGYCPVDMYIDLDRKCKISELKSICVFKIKAAIPHKEDGFVAFETRELVGFVACDVNGEGYVGAPAEIIGSKGGDNGVVRLCCALLMLWRSRPEYVVPITLPRSERYNFKGDRSLLRTWKLPDKLLIRPRVDSTPTGQHVRAHWRAGHFRHYRHERYERRPDGSVKIEFIEPCMIHADQLEPVQ